MKIYLSLLLSLFLLISCDNLGMLPDTPQPNEEDCEFQTEIFSPEGYEIQPIGEINANSSIQLFQFVDEQTGYALGGNQVGGHAELFKTNDGGQSWKDLDLGVDQYPKGMVFRDQDLGIITVQDVTGCPSNCQNKCVILRTENGGEDWEEIQYEELQGILYHPTFDANGDLYAFLSFDNQAALMKSIDNGSSWDTLFSSPDLGFSLLTFSFELYEDKIYASSKEGKILVLDLQGNLMETLEIGGDSPVWDLEIIDEDNLVVVLSQEVIKSSNGGRIWERIYEESARMIGFESPERGLMLLEESSCLGDVYQANDLIAWSNNSGRRWITPEETTTNLRIHFANSQQMKAGSWFILIENKLLEIKEK